MTTLHRPTHPSLVVLLCPWILISFQAFNLSPILMPHPISLHRNLFVCCPHILFIYKYPSGVESGERLRWLRVGQSPGRQAPRQAPGQEKGAGEIIHLRNFCCSQFPLISDFWCGTHRKQRRSFFFYRQVGEYKTGWANPHVGHFFIKINHTQPFEQKMNIKHWLICGMLTRGPPSKQPSTQLMAVFRPVLRLGSTFFINVGLRLWTKNNVLQNIPMWICLKLQLTSTPKHISPRPILDRDWYS